MNRVEFILGFIVQSVLFTLGFLCIFGVGFTLLFRNAPQPVVWLAAAPILCGTGTAVWFTRCDRREARKTEKPAKMNRKQLFTLIFLLLLCWPAGLVYLSRLWRWRAGGRIGCGILCLPPMLFASWLASVCISNAFPLRMSHVSAKECRTGFRLPEGAEDITSYRTYSWSEFECVCTEAAFRKWANRELEEIKGEERYSLQDSPETEIRVVNGLRASRRGSNGGGFRMIYDRDRGKMYFQTNPR